MSSRRRRSTRKRNSNPDYIMESDHDSSSEVLSVQNATDSVPVNELASGSLVVNLTSPSKIQEVNLSESESSNDEENIEIVQSTDEEPTAISVFKECKDVKLESTNYDFSQIISLQTQLTKARAEYNSKISDNAVASQFSHDECSISELLAKGEKSTILMHDSSSDAESEDSIQPTPVQITLEMPSKTKTLNKKECQSALLKKQLQSIVQENQLILHKVHLLCLIAHGNFVNTFFINNDTIYGYLLSLLPDSHVTYTSIPYVKKLLKWFGNTFKLVNKSSTPQIFSLQHLEVIITDKKECTIKEAVILFVSLLRGLGFTARFVLCLNPLPLKPAIPQANGSSKDEKIKKAGPPKDETSSSNKSITKQTSGNNSALMKTKKASDVMQKSTSKATLSSSKKRKVKLVEEAEDIKVDSKAKKVETSKKRRVLSSDSEDSPNTSKPCIDCWAEIYMANKKTWITIDVFSLQVDCTEIISARVQPHTYIVGWKNDNTLKDITRRYVPCWLSKKKKRVDKVWWEKSLSPFQGKMTALEKLEDEKFDVQDAKAPIPSSITQLKGHPLYVLQRHLLKYEGIYPPDAAPLGFVRGEAVYSRYCVYELFSREKWLREGKCVRANEKPYKNVKSRKSDKFSGIEKPLELFGQWQVEDYIPPAAVDGKVPRNEYGNVELYKPNMLPAGTIHLQVPGILRVAKRLNIDCAPAVIGWEFHGGRAHPVIEGAVVCKEFQSALMDAWNNEMDASAQRSDHRKKQLVYKRWRKIITFVKVKEKLKKKYNFGEVSN